MTAHARPLTPDEEPLCASAVAATVRTLRWDDGPVFTERLPVRALLWPTAEDRLAGLTAAQLAGLHRAGGDDEAFALAEIREPVSGEHWPPPQVLRLDDHAAYVRDTTLADHVLVARDGSWAAICHFDDWGLIGGSEELVTAVAGNRAARIAMAADWLHELGDEVGPRRARPYDAGWIAPLLRHLLGDADAANVLARAGDWLALHDPQPPWAAEDFFAGADAHVAARAPQHAPALSALRAILARCQLRYARPDGTRADATADGPLRLVVRHAAADVELVAELGDDTVTLRWPSGTFARPRWDADVDAVARAVLAGDNRLRVTLAHGAPPQTETTMWVHGEHRTLDVRLPEAFLRELQAAFGTPAWIEHTLSFAWDGGAYTGPVSVGG